MDKKVVDLAEALKSPFQADWFPKFLVVFFVSILAGSSSLIGMIYQNRTFQPKDIPALLLIFLVTFVAMLMITGFYSIYAHDRALDKNAEVRNLAWCPVDAFLVGAKHVFGCLLNCIFIQIILFVAIGIPALVLAFIPILGVIVDIILITVLWPIIFINVMFRLNCNFAKDLNFVSWFQWRKAFALTKGVPFGKLQGFLAFLVAIGVVILVSVITFIIVFPIALVSGGNGLVSNITTFLILPLAIFMNFFIYLFWSNLAGQYTYNAIENKIGGSPEKLPKQINNDAGVAIFLAIIMLILYLGIGIAVVNAPRTMNTNPYTMGTNGSPFGSYNGSNMSNGLNSGKESSSGALGTLVERQSDVYAKVKMKKSVSAYETMAEIYMAENDKKNVSEMFDSDCSNADVYLKIEETKGTCEFVRMDGTYWKINPNTGEVTVSDSYLNPKYTLTMGVCSNSKPNCKEEYPEVEQLMNSH